MLLTVTLAGDTVVSLYLTTRADRLGRRRMLIIGALLMAAAGLTFANTRSLGFTRWRDTVAPSPAEGDGACRELPRSCPSLCPSRRPVGAALHPSFAGR